MRAKIEVESREEAQLIRKGLTDGPTRALVKVVGALLPLSTAGQKRILDFMESYFEDNP